MNLRVIASSMTQRNFILSCTLMFLCFSFNFDIVVGSLVKPCEEGEWYGGCNGRKLWNMSGG